MSEYIVRIDDDAPDDFARAVSTEIVQELVRCGECKHYIRHDKRCTAWNHGVEKDGFCYKGERKGGEDGVDG